MGGVGSGERLNRRRTVEEVLALDVGWLRRTGRLSPGIAGAVEWRRDGRLLGRIFVACQSDAEVQVDSQAVEVEWTPAGFGGVRPWFRCACGRRVARLYLYAGAACRICHGLGYWTQRRRAADRALARWHDLARRAGAERGGAPIPLPPKYTRTWRWLALVNEIDRAGRRAMALWRR